LALPAAAQDYPAREIRSICNFAAGSGADIVVRFYSDRLSQAGRQAGGGREQARQPGHGGNRFVAKSKPDGYTIMITPASSTLATAPHIFKTLPFDPAKDFAPVTTITLAQLRHRRRRGEADQTIPEIDQFLKAKPSTASTAPARTPARSRPSSSRSAPGCKPPTCRSRPRSARSPRC
jgi:tripartite-type tricarboxylate transporter receptor subunit TctC